MLALVEKFKLAACGFLSSRAKVSFLCVENAIVVKFKVGDFLCVKLKFVFGETFLVHL